MNSLLATSLVLLISLGFGCSQDADLEMFNYTDDCIMISIKFEINVTYPQNDGNDTWVIIPGVNFTEVDMPPDCDGGTASLAIPWLENIFLTLNFVADGEKFWNISSVMFEYVIAGNEQYFDDPADDFDGDTLNGTIEDQHLRKVAWNTSYSCPLNKSVDLMSVDNQRAKIRIPFIQVQAFSFPMSGNFSTGFNCEDADTGGSSDDDDKIVPIAVGCALAGLVIIVLIAYLIGRFRNRKTDTYQVLS